MADGWAAGHAAGLGGPPSLIPPKTFPAWITVPDCWPVTWFTVACPASSSALAPASQSSSPAANPGSVLARPARSPARPPGLAGSAFPGACGFDGLGLCRVVPEDPARQRRQRRPRVLACLPGGTVRERGQYL
jgi:hypothetical protein